MCRYNYSLSLLTAANPGYILSLKQLRFKIFVRYIGIFIENSPLVVLITYSLSGGLNFLSAFYISYSVISIRQKIKILT